MLDDSDMEEVAAVSAMALGFTYLYWKYKQNKTKKRKVQQRRWWMAKTHRNRTRQFMENKFNELLLEPSGEIDNFCRMSYTDFEFLLNKISPMISKADTHLREAIPAKYRLAITLRYLASGDSLRSLNHLFNVSESSISNIIREVCRALNAVLQDEIKMPATREGWHTIEEGFRSEFPHCIGALEGKHIVIENPALSGTQSTFGIVLFALVDSQHKFIYVDINHQGRISDGGVLDNTLLWQRICRNEIDFPPPSPLPGSDMNVPYVFLADGAFALSTHVMKPYPGNHDVGSLKMIFNQTLFRSRVVVENTFGILTSVFRIFRRPIINSNPHVVSEITMTCVLLHNYLRTSESSSNIYTPPESFDVYDNGDNLITLGSWRRNNEYNVMKNLPHIPRRSPLDAGQIRDEFASYFYKSAPGNL